jgi:ABC-type transport system involved in cytochrome bd biosynthesis fused ATPase/permease subunit
LLLFDEATAHLDADTERLILAALSALKGRVTLILVAHRPEALAICDRVVRLAAGRVVGGARGDEPGAAGDASHPAP